MRQNHKTEKKKKKKKNPWIFEKNASLGDSVT